MLCREKFSIPKGLIADAIGIIVRRGVCIEPKVDYMGVKDPKDAPIFAIATESRDLGTYLITGNSKHFPDVDFVITAKDAVSLIRE